MWYLSRTHHLWNCVRHQRRIKESVHHDITIYMLNLLSTTTVVDYNGYLCLTFYLIYAFSEFLYKAWSWIADLYYKEIIGFLAMVLTDEICFLGSWTLLSEIMDCWCWIDYTFHKEIWPRYGKFDQEIFIEFSGCCKWKLWG